MSSRQRGGSPGCSIGAPRGVWGLARALTVLALLAALRPACAEATATLPLQDAAGSSTSTAVTKAQADPEPPLPGESADWTVHAQFTLIEQWHPTFAAPYTGANSLTPAAVGDETIDTTLFLGRRLWSGAELYFNPEIDQGYGLSNTLGIAGFPSGGAYKVGEWQPYYRTPRLFIRQTFDLGGDPLALEDGPNQIAKTITSDNLIVTAGKFSVVDVFDTNSYAHDPRADFLNWVNVDAGAFDYAADAWGYSLGAAVEWTQSWWTLRSGFFALSTVPNSEAIDTNFQQFEWVEEFEERHELAGHPGKLKVLAFLNHGQMGSYQDAIRRAGLPGPGTVPSTALVRRTANRAGGSLNLEQELGASVGVFARLSADNGSEEAFEFTEVNASVSAGAQLKGDLWGRSRDSAGVALIANALSGDARAYFGLGGLGILIGDGRLNYGPELITEIYYNWSVIEHLALSLDYQHVIDPGYNRDRGPVDVIGLRFHVDL